MAQPFKTFSIRLPDGRTLEAKDGETLSEVLLREEVPLLSVCRGRGTCGKCLVEIVKGDTGPPDDEERGILEAKGISGPFRLACRTPVTGDLEIRIPAGSLFQEMKILGRGTHVPFVFSPPAERLPLSLPPSTVSDPLSFQERLERALGRKIHLPAGLLRNLDEKVLRAESLLVTVEHEGRVLDIAPPDAPSGHFGIAVDIGTTTVVMALADFEKGIVDHAMAMNRQGYYGSDVVSRLTYAFSDPAGTAHLQKKIVQTLNHMIGELCSGNGMDPLRITQMTAAGNTAMIHFLFGIPATTLAVGPFSAVFQRAGEVRARELGLRIHPDAGVYAAPAIRSFVGGDISAGLLAAGLAGREGNHLFVDLGTNGEIVLKKGKRMIATSTAAGPAFEGARISRGTLAVPGAVCGADWDGGLVLRTVGNLPPAGICGTGLLDLASVFLERGELGPDGDIRNPEKVLRVTEDIAVTQRDIRELQMAVAAVRTGMKLLMKHAGLGFGDLDGLIVAGAFGSELNLDRSRRLGLLPPIADDRIAFAGNTSLSGAVMALLSVVERRKLDRIAGRVRYVSLASDPDFQDIFISAFRFGEGFF